MDELKIFKNEKFGEIRTVEENGKVLFYGNDVAKALGYKRPADAITAHCKGSVIYRILTEGGEQNVKFITEGDIYRLAAKSKLPGADEFERWIFDEVLPMIRKTGGYVNNDDLFINTYLSNIEEPVKQLFRVTLKVLRNQNQIINSQNQQLIEQKPKVEFADCVGSSKDLLTIGQFSKLVHDENIPVGRNRLFKWMRDKGYLRQNNEPYQQYIDSGFFKVKEGAKQNQYGSKLFTVTLITGKGQIYFAEKLRNEFVSQSVS